MPYRVQLSRKKGWRMPPDTVSVARPTVWGNPYAVDVYGIALALKLYDDSLRGLWSPANVAQLDDDLAHRAYQLHCLFRARIRERSVQWELGGKNLACWCSIHESCHADILLKLANPVIYTRAAAAVITSDSLSTESHSADKQSPYLSEP